MTDYGVTPEGFVKKSLSVIKAEVQDDLRGSISPTLNLLDTSNIGQLTGIFSDKVREGWDVVEAVYRAFYPDSSSDEALEQVASITGARRLGTTKSTVTLDQLFLDGGTTLAVGKTVSIGSDGNRFALIEAITNPTAYPGTYSAESESEEFGEITGYAQTIDEIQTPVSGWNAKCAISCSIIENYAISISETLIIEVDQSAAQTVTWPGGGTFTAAQVATEINGQTTGLTAYDAGGYVRIASDTDGTGSAIQITGGTANPVLGFPLTLIKGFNTEDADAGRLVETDPDFRTRREELLRATGSATVEAIRASIRALTAFVTQCFVFENTTLITDGDGVPGKAFEAVVNGVTTSDQEQIVAETIWEEKPAGIESHGSISKTVVDSQGFSHTIKFSKPTEVPIYIEVTVDTDATLFPADGADQIKAAIVAYGAALQIGEDVVALQFKCVPLSVAGVEDITAFLIDDVDPPVSAVNIVIGNRDLATFDTGDIDVTVT